MSRIGRLPVTIPAKVDVKIDGQTVTVKGPKGELSETFRSEMAIKVEDGQVVVERENDSRQNRALHGLTRALINNMVVGVSEGWSRTLELQGVGYRVTLKGKSLDFSLGFSHPVVIDPPDGISFEVDPKANTIKVMGADKSQVGQVAANLRGLRPVEPYKGKGMRYQGEQVKRKAGKAGKV